MCPEAGVFAFACQVVAVEHNSEFRTKRMAGCEEFVCFPTRCSEATDELARAPIRLPSVDDKAALLRALRLAFVGMGEVRLRGNGLIADKRMS